MEILKFEEAPQRPTRSRTRAKKSSSKTMLGIAAAAVIAVVGSTLAANISLTSGSTSEFGQGLVQAAACDNAITVVPASTFLNASGAGVFNFSSVALSGISDSCVGRTFTINAWNDTTQQANNIASYNGTAYANATFSYATVSNGGTITLTPGLTTSNWSRSDSATGAVTINFTTPQATSGSVYKITIQTN